jgi:hypothetical protein
MDVVEAALTKEPANQLNDVSIVDQLVQRARPMERPGRASGVPDPTSRDPQGLCHVTLPDRKVRHGYNPAERDRAMAHHIWWADTRPCASYRGIRRAPPH